MKHKQQGTTMLIGIDPKHYFKSPNGGQARLPGNDAFSVLNHLFKKNISSIIPKLKYQGKKR